MSQSLATLVGGIAGGLIVMVLVIGFLWYCISRCKIFSNRSSETGSSDPCALVEWNRDGSISTRGNPLSGSQGARQFKLEELEQATKQFSESNLIGEGTFGLVYKGLLHDGTVVAVKRRLGAPQREFVDKVSYLSEIRHRNLVTLLGYSQEDGFQMLVYEHLPNGSVSNHLHKKNSTTHLEFKRRLSIALGAAKGLCHLHCLSPPLIHKNLKTSNVLVDENFIAKVADAGLYKLLEKIDDASPSSGTSGDNVFQDPEDRESEMVSETSDVYSFGVFLVEIVSGEDASKINLFGSAENFIHQVKSRVASNNIVDSRLAGSFTLEGMKDLISLTLRCLTTDRHARPNMNMIVSELDQILAKEMTWRTGMPESTTTVTLGSQLFTTG